MGATGDAMLIQDRKHQITPLLQNSTIPSLENECGEAAKRIPSSSISVFSIAGHIPAITITIQIRSFPSSSHRVRFTHATVVPKDKGLFLSPRALLCYSARAICLHHRFGLRCAGLLSPAQHRGLRPTRRFFPFEILPFEWKDFGHFHR